MFSLGEVALGASGFLIRSIILFLFPETREDFKGFVRQYQNDQGTDGNGAGEFEPCQSIGISGKDIAFDGSLHGVVNGGTRHQ